MRHRDISMRMASMMTLVCVLAGSFAVLAAQAQTSSVPPKDYIEFDGTKDPDAIPLYLAWEHAFRTLRVVPRGKVRGIRATLHLSPADDALVNVEADAQQSRDNTCEARQRRRLDAIEKVHGKYMQMKEEPRARTKEELYEIAIGCRQEVLDASERLLSKMTPEGQVELQRWVMEGRENIQSFVPKQDLKYYRLPR